MLISDDLSMGDAVYVLVPSLGINLAVISTVVPCSNHRPTHSEGVVECSKFCHKLVHPWSEIRLGEL